MLKRCLIDEKQVVLQTDGEICSTIHRMLASKQFEQIVGLYWDYLGDHDSALLEPFQREGQADSGRAVLLLRALADLSYQQACQRVPEVFVGMGEQDRDQLVAFVEGLYDFWRSHDRYMVLRGQPGPSGFEQRPYRSFNVTVEHFEHTVRAAYRDICENLTGDHSRIYRQVAAGADVALIAAELDGGLPESYRGPLAKIPFIRQAWIAPPMIIDPPYNKRTGQFRRVDESPLLGAELDPSEWLCFPAQVGGVVIYLYFHHEFMGLGCSLSNLFELATDEQIAAGPDALIVFGLPSQNLARFGELPTVFHDDPQTGKLVGAVPRERQFGYFGYLKKLALTLHNIIMLKRGRMPFHGAMVRIELKNRAAANVLIIGDTATGKSESLEAFRTLGATRIRQMSVVADDMGSLELNEEGQVMAYGTEVGAFIRLDDLQQGYVFTQVDRAIIMSPHKTNARVVVPITTLKEVLRGYEVNYLLYANNYEETDDDHPVLERFESVDHALDVFRQGAAMAKGTTTATGLVHSYFANIFGPPQYRDLHDVYARQVFEAAHQRGVFMGQLRTCLGVAGYESKGPEEAAKALFRAIGE
jgi:hypothetical protein